MTNQKKKKFEWPRHLTWFYIKNNIRKVTFLIIYTIINIVLFVSSVIRYKDTNGFVMVARGCGMCLNFNCSLIVGLMLRKTLTWLRTSKAGDYLPVDQHILFHRMVGWMILFYSLLHTFSHLGNLGIVVKHYSSDPNDTTTKFAYWELVFKTSPGIGWIGGFAPLSGVILEAILIIMVICALPFVRRKGYFQVFYWTHFLYVFFFVLLFFHGPIFWCFILVPGVIFCIEKILNSEVVNKARYGNAYITEVNLLPSRVTHLVIDKPEGFKYHAGDYIFIRIPDIAKHEWHPFTVSSAPELDDYLWLHIRSAGHWTNKIYQHFKSYKMPKFRVSSSKFTDFSEMESGQRDFKKASARKKSIFNSGTRFTRTRVYIDGPYGTSARDVFNVDHVVLIASGIGVTPYASILQSIMYRHHASTVKCPKCTNTFYQDNHRLMSLKKVNFVWVNRDQNAFEWFINMLSELEHLQAVMNKFAENFLEMEMYMTSALKKGDVKAVGLQMALNLVHEQSDVDMLSGLKTRVNPGRPNWDELFKRLSKEKRGNVKVFFCGAPALAKSLKAKSAQYGFAFSKENF